jgi:hypothetical protein
MIKLVSDTIDRDDIKHLIEWLSQDEIPRLTKGDLTIEFRDLVCQELDLLNAKYIKDLDEESLSMYLNRIKTGSGSVVVEYHVSDGDSC